MIDNNDLTSSIESTRSEFMSKTDPNLIDPKTKELKLIKREMAAIVRENQKLQTELKTKNETINSLINQNFTELKLLQEKHNDIIKELTLSYQKNVSDIDSKYKIFKSSVNQKIKDSLETHHKLDNEKTHLMANYNVELAKNLSDLRSEIALKDSKITELTESQIKSNSKSTEFALLVDELKQKNDSLNRHFNELSISHKILENTNSENIKLISDLKSQNDKLIYDSNNNNEKIIYDLNAQIDKLKYELNKTTLQNQTDTDTINHITKEINTLKSVNNEFYNKYLLLLNDNTTKQNSIDEKTLEILSLNSKANELEKKLITMETYKKDTNVKLMELLNQIDILKTDLYAAQKTVQQLKNDKDNFTDEKQYYTQEIERLRASNKENESSILVRIQQIQDITTQEKEKYINDFEARLVDQRNKYEKQLTAQQVNHASIVSDLENRIKGLTNHLKSYTDNQYNTFNEIEKIKSINEKLKAEQYDIDQRITEIHVQTRKEIDELRTLHKKEKDTIMESYNDTIKKSQEVNEALQIRLNQTMEALSLSKTTISNLKDNNQSLQKQLQTKDTEDNSVMDKYNEIKADNLSLTEKLERSIELNNIFSTKEKQYEAQLKQLQSKYNQLVSIAKKGSNQLTSENK
jgi:chromosome segregation ATPase